MRRRVRKGEGGEGKEVEGEKKELLSHQREGSKVHICVCVYVYVCVCVCIGMHSFSKASCKAGSEPSSEPSLHLRASKLRGTNSTLLLPHSLHQPQTTLPLCTKTGPGTFSLLKVRPLRNYLFLHRLKPPSPTAGYTYTCPQGSPSRAARPPPALGPPRAGQSAPRAAVSLGHEARLLPQGTPLLLMLHSKSCS